jgi:alanyl aminopeptidase
MRVYVALLGVVACSSSSTPPARSPVAHRPAAPPADARTESTPGLRLPRTFLPTGYAARLVIDPAAAGFDGSVAITGELALRSSVIWLHGRELTIRRATASQHGRTIAVTVTPHGEDLLELRAPAPLDAGTWTVTIEYAGTYDLRGSSGAYRQTVRGASYVYTQLEAIYARRVLPCFDEPDSKVPWQLTLDVPDGLVAVSNTPIAKEQPLGGGRKRVEFAVTRPLPSYLVAFGVGPFDIVDAGATRGGTPVRILTMRDRAAEAGFAASTTPRILELLEEFFGSPYPYEKLDILTIPVSTGFGAMENAGLVTADETVVLSDPKRPAQRRRRAWVSTGAHELAHHWFGNLVTPAWWDDIWLNEGFATWATHKIAAKFEPGWHDELAAVETRSHALLNDALVSARQLHQPIVATDDIFNAFDGISYNKGASVLNMLERYVGPERFLQGLRSYLKQHAYRNATSEDFAAAISEAAAKDIRPVLRSFLQQSGAPELTVGLSCERGAPPRLVISQRRYLTPGAPAPAAGAPWVVPVCVAFERGGKRAEACSLLDATAGEIVLDTASCPRWVMGNADGRGYYRNAYTSAELVVLRDQAWPALLPSERQVLAFDVTEAAIDGRVKLALALSFLPKLLAEGDRMAIRAALRLPLFLANLIPDALRPRYEAWMRQAFGAAARRAGLMPRPGESLDVEIGRAHLISAAAVIGRDPALTGEAIRLAAGWRDLPEAIRGNVLAVAARGSPRVFAGLLAAAPAETDRTRRVQLLDALASTPDVAQQRAALALMLDSRLDIRETQHMLFGSSIEANRRVAQQFFRDHKAALLARLPKDSVTGSTAWFAEVFTASCAPERRDEIAAYVTETFATMPGGERVVRQAIERMDQCIAQRRRLEPGIHAWLPAARAIATIGR